jgi:hypothetical protein
MDSLQSDKKSKKFLLVAVLAAVLLTIGAGYWFFVVKNGFQKEQTKEGGMGTEFELCQSNGLNLIEKINSTTFTKDIDYSEMRYLLLVSLIKNDNKYCKLISTQDLQNTCLDMFYSYASLRESSCNEVKNESLKSFCLAVKDNNQDFCPKGDNYESKICVATATGSLGICDELEKTEKGLGETCKSNVYLKTAVKENNIGICEKINRNNNLGNEINYLICRSFFENKEEVFKEANESYKRGICYSKYSLNNSKKENDIRECEKIQWKEITNKGLYMECIKQFE